MSLDLQGCCDTECENIIYQSGDTLVHFALETCEKKPFDVSAATEIWAMFPVPGNPPIILKLSTSTLTVTNGGGGEFEGTITKVQALQLPVGPIDIEVRVTIDGVITVTEILGKVTVTASLFPGY